MARNRTLVATIGGLAVVLGARELLQRRKYLDLQGKTVVITGGSRGLGLAMAEEFARHGARLALCARDVEDLQEAQETLTNMGAEVLTFPCDVSDPAQVERMVQHVSERFGQIDILVNNAGIISTGPWQTTTRADFEQAMNIMFWGTYNATMAVLPQMKQRGEGRIVNITSIGGKVSVPHLLPYASAKFAAVGFSEGLHAELARDGITVVTVVPGLLRTGSPRNAIAKGERHKEEYTVFLLADTSPASSISARRAARQIVHATRRGTTELIITIQAQLMARFHGLFPGLTTDLLSVVNRFLPSGEGAGTASYSGKESETAVSQSPLTALGRKAEREYHELDKDRG